MMLTSDLASGDKERCRRLGIAATLVKPIQQSETVGRNFEHFGDQRQRIARTGNGGTAS